MFVLLVGLELKFVWIFLLVDNIYKKWISKFDIGLNKWFWEYLFLVWKKIYLELKVLIGIWDVLIILFVIKYFEGGYKCFLVFGSDK